MDRIGPKARLIPERDLGVGPFGLVRNRGIRFALPAINRVGIPLIRPRQGLLRRQALSRQQRTNRGQTQPHAESLRHPFAHDLTRPQTNLEPVLPRMFPLDPAKHLSFLPRGQGPWAAGRGARRARVESVATPTCRREPAIERAAMNAVAGARARRPSCGWSPECRDPVSVRLAS